MEFNNIILFIIGISSLSCQQRSELDHSEDKDIKEMAVSIPMDSLRLIPVEGLYYLNSKSFSGTAVAHYPNGKLASAIDFVHGKKHGLYKKWFGDGQLSYKSAYNRGRQHGITRTWWHDGTRRSESTFANGVADGKQFQWYSSGVKFKEINLVAGREEGMQRSWRENGKIYNNYEAKNGRIFGLKRATLCYELEDESVQFNQ